MANKNLALRLLITAKDEASGVMSSMQAKAAAVAAAIASYFTVDFFSGAVKSAAAFEAAMSRVAAATGATGDELQQLKIAAEEASAGSAFTQVETAQALENLAKAGLNARESIAALPGVMSLAAAGDIELAQAAEIVTRTVAGMGIAVEDTARIADVLAKGANASNTSVKGLAEALSYTAPTARSAGLSLEQTVAVLGKFADGGIDASRAGTALNAILSQFIDPASKFRSELAAIGITTNDFDRALRQLAASGGAGSKAILAVGTEAGPALRSLINQGVPALDKLKAQLDDAGGSAAETARIMNANLDGAVKGLSGAWESVKTKLGEPVLPVLTQGVKDLDDSLRGAIANGTVSQFGEALRSAFSSGIEWVRKFAAEIDPAALTAKLQETAGKIGAFFDDFGAKATNAGNLIQAAWGVMSAGSNILLSGVYKLGEIFSAITFGILQDLAAIASGMSRVTFGSISEGFKAAAAELSIQAGAAASVAEAYGLKAREAFEGAVAGAETARAGWAGLTAPAQQAGQAVSEVGQAADTTSKQLKATGDDAVEVGQKLDILGNQAKQSGATQKAAAEDVQKSIDALKSKYYELFQAGKRDEAEAVWLQLQAVMRQTSVVASETGKAQKAAAAEAMQSVNALRAEYDKLLAGGKVNEAVLKMEEIRNALGGLKTDAKATAAELDAAYRGLGIASTADLKAKEQEFRRYYDAIKTDGTATADMLAQAFKVYAEKAIAANGGVVSGAIAAEASMRGLTVQSDGAKVSIDKLGAAGRSAGAGVSAGMAEASTAVRRVQTEADALQQRLASLKGAGLGDNFGNQSTGNGNFEALRKAGITGQDMQRMGYSSREIEDYLTQNDKAAPGTVNRQVTSSSVNVMQMGADAGLSPEEIRKLIEVYPYFAAAANTESKKRAAGDGGLTFGGDDYAAVTREYADKAIAEARRLAQADKQPGGSNQGGSAGFWGGPRSVTVNLNLGGRQTQVEVTDQSQADALLRVLEQAGLATR